MQARVVLAALLGVMIVVTIATWGTRRIPSSPDGTAAGRALIGSPPAPLPSALGSAVSDVIPR